MALTSLGGNPDMGTLIDILRGLSEGRNIDSTPFGMWGVRDMDPKALGMLMNQASNIHQENLAKQMGLLGQSTNAAADFLGKQSIADAANYGHDVTLAGYPVQERIAAQRTAAQAAAETLKSQTQKDVAGIKGAFGNKSAEIMAAAKDKPQPLGQLGMALLQKFRDPKIKGSEIEGDIAFLRTMNYNTGPLEELLMKREADLAAKKPEGPGLLSRATASPIPPNPYAERQMAGSQPTLIDLLRKAQFANTGDLSQFGATP